MKQSRIAPQGAGALLATLLFALLLALPGQAMAARGGALEIMIDRGETLQLANPAGSVSIANPEIADIQVLSPTTVMVFGKKVGETTLLAVTEAGAVMLERAVRVTLNLEDIHHALDVLLPGNNIQVAAVPNGIMLTGDVADPGAAEDAHRVAARYIPDKGEIIDRLRIQSSNQIHLRVRVAEISRDVTKQFGINWSNAFQLGNNFALGLITGTTAVPTGPFGINVSRPNEANVLGFNFANGNNADINGFIDALASDGLISLLAEPNLTAMSGQTAYFLAGGEFPVIVPQDDQTLTVQFKDYGIKLSFTPTLVNENRINLRVRPEVSELSSEGAVVLANLQIPSLRVRRAETTVEVASGQSFAIAGLVSNSQNQSVRKFPFLGDMPVLGALFRSTSFQNDQSELVIIVTPYLVKPTSTQQLAMPTDGYAPPTETDRLLDLRRVASDPMSRNMSGAPVAAAVTAQPPVSAPVQAGGFIVE